MGRDSDARRDAMLHRSVNVVGRRSPVSCLSMDDPYDPQDPWPLPPAPPSRLRQIASIAIVLSLVASMIFLAWVSGRGEMVVTPSPTATPAPTLTIARR